MRRTVMVLGAALSVLAVAGCDLSVSGAARAGAGPSAAASAPSAVPVTPATPVGPPPDYRACADGNCEVAVTGPVDIPLGGHGGATTMSVHSVSEDSIAYTTSGPGGSGSGDISGGGVVSFGDGSGAVTMTIVRSVPGGVVIRLSTS